MKKSIHYFIIALLSLTVLTLSVVALNPEWRKQAQHLFRAQQKRVLAAVSGRFIPERPPLRAVKIIDNDEVFIEIFEESPDGALNKLYVIRTGHPHDGQFNFKGQVSRLVASDLDKDGHDELLVPAFDQNLRPRLHVYKYQPELKEFQEIPPPSQL